MTSDKSDGREKSLGSSKEGLTGSDELKNHKFVYNVEGQVETYMKTADAIADHVGTVLSSEMFRLVKKQEETTFPEPAEVGKDATRGQIKKYELELQEAIRKQSTYEKEKGLVFRLIMTQCSKMMRNKVEELPKFEEWQKNHQVTELLKAIKVLVHNTEGTQFEYWVMQMQWRRLFRIEQGPNEPLAGYCRRFIDQVAVVEELWGDMVPWSMKDKGADKANEARNQYLACLLLGGVDKGYKGTINELCNDFLNGQTNYPKDVPGMVAYLSNRKGGKVNLNGGYRGKNRYNNKYHKGKSFAQIKCYNCNELGHMARDCPNGDDTSVESGSSKVSFQSKASRASSKGGKYLKKNNKKNGKKGQEERGWSS